MKKRYIEKLGAKLSPLGFGVMRLPMKGGEFPEEVYRLLDRAEIGRASCRERV